MSPHQIEMLARKARDRISSWVDCIELGNWQAVQGLTNSIFDLPIVTLWKVLP